MLLIRLSLKNRLFVCSGIVCLFLTIALLNGCAGTGKAPVTTTAEHKAASTMDAEALLADAMHRTSPARENLQLQAAEILWSAPDKQPDQRNRALALLLNIDPAKLSDSHFGEYTLLYGRWAFDKEQAELARQILANQRIEQLLPELDIAQAIDLYELRSRFFTWNRQPLQAINDRMALTTLLTNKDQQEKNQELLWSSLQQLTSDELEQLSLNQPGKQLMAWIELSRITTSQELDLDAQATLLDEWLDRYPHHPAAQNLPPELRLLQSAIKQRPQNVTLLLPLSGNLQKAGEAVRDGFMAAYYQAMKRGYPLPRVRVVNSQQDSNFLALYDRVAGNNTDLIIGPLEKEKVTLLQDKWRIAVPTLALNDAASTADKTTNNLYLFSLNPEDEARQAAQEARQHHYERALVIAPANEWGQRLSNAFFTEWAAQGGTALATVQYDTNKDDYSTVIQQALGINDSKNRKQWLRQWTNESLEFEPRRRQDIDVIFLVARPDVARQIKPLLAFHYAGQIPVYAGSSIYSGQPAPEKDTDLDGIHLLVAPWLFEASELKTEVDARLSPDANLQSLYALGADAWRLHARLPLLAADTRSRLHGYTGILSLDNKQRIYRQQIWATIDKGHITMLPSPNRP